jgi:hypothetical protein
VITSSRAKVDAWTVNPSGPARWSNTLATAASETPAWRSRATTRPVTRRTSASASIPRAAASVRQRPYSVSGASCCLALRVAWTAHFTSRGVRARPDASRRSTSAVTCSARLENARTNFAGTPTSSRLPCRSARVHATSRDRVSARW